MTFTSKTSIHHFKKIKWPEIRNSYEADSAIGISFLLKKCRVLNLTNVEWVTSIAQKENRIRVALFKKRLHFPLKNSKNIFNQPDANLHSVGNSIYINKQKYI